MLSIIVWSCPACHGTPLSVALGDDVGGEALECMVLCATTVG